MAKINLLTIHYDDNNGVFLQTYATCELLKSLGHQVTIINLMPKKWFFGRFKTAYSFKLIFRYVYFEICRIIYFPRRTRIMFAPDVKHIPDADYTIVGSDQVWNKSITGYSYLSYFLDFLPQQAKRISLASSLGKTFIDSDEAEKKQIHQLLSLFSGISVREKSGVEIIKREFQLDSEVLIDPTLALGDFEKLTSKRIKARGYVGLFTFKPKGYSMSVSKYVAKILDKPLLWVNSFAFTRDCADYKVGHTEFQSPREWLAYIKNADFFISDSFHGIVFCLIFHTPFIAVCADEAKFERISSLLETVGLSDRIIKSQDALTENINIIAKPIDWNNVEQTLQKERVKYIEFIKTHIA